MTIAHPQFDASAFEPKSDQELRAIRDKLVNELLPRTVEELKFLRSIDEITADDDDLLDEIQALDFVLGDE